MIDCILHFSVLNTRSSILCMVLASNMNFDSATYQLSQFIITRTKHNIIKAQLLQRHSNRQFNLPANLGRKELQSLPSWKQVIHMLQLAIASSRPCSSFSKVEINGVSNCKIDQLICKSTSPEMWCQ